MRLVSKLHDYYDGVARNTIHDKTHTFVREQRYIENFDISMLYFSDLEYKDITYTVEPEIVGFCGKIYPCVRIVKGSNGVVYDAPDKIFYAYDFETFKSFIPNDAIERGYGRIRVWRRTSELGNIKAWLEYGRERSSWYKETITELKNDPKLKKVFMDEKVAYFHINRVNRRSKYTLQTYPLLKDLQFYKVFETYSCFQAIEYYLTNELVKPDEIPPEIQATITDGLKAQAHGFNKLSFRKEPTKKK